MKVVLHEFYIGLAILSQEIVVGLVLYPVP